MRYVRFDHGYYYFWLDAGYYCQYDMGSYRGEIMRTCDICKCVNFTHGSCESRGHDDRCHGVHTMYFCDCDCCACEDTTRVKESV